ncbi:hypothetical protein [uncultured Megasphaera sp.]|uniref:hypothetical protein n=1 Tax=uncultured Megasphaera sp. TaxID=165188 RepID=UPI0028683EC5|nr:hypothetical protein [uncultured Megasphaera sp.]
MKKWQILLGTLCFSLAGLTALAADAPQAAPTETAAKTAAVVLTDPTVNVKNLSDFYILKGSTYDRVTGLLKNLPSQTTGLVGDYYFRIDKNVVGDYFYHVKAYDTASHVLIGNYFVAKDESCAWKMQSGENAALIYGNTEKLMDKVEVVVYPKKIPLGSYGIIRVHVPGMIPYDVKATSLNTKVAAITDKMNIEPVQAGKTDLVIDVKIGDTVRTVTKQVTVVDTADARTSSPSHSGPNVGVGIGIGWGGGWHHHGGVGIGIGPWW